MALLNFPANPSPNQTHTIGSNTWVWNGYAWVKYPSSTASPIQINTNTVSTGTNTGAVVISGGIGVGGGLNAGGTSTIGGSVIITTSTLNQYATLQTITDAGNSTTNVVYITNTTQSTSTVTGAVLIDGGLAVGGNIYVGGFINVAGKMTSNGSEIITTTTVGTFSIDTLNDVSVRGHTSTVALYISNTTESTSTTTGALVVDGGIGIGRDLWVQGRINSESLKIMDAILDSTELVVNTTGTVVIDAYPIGQFRSSKYLIQIEESGVNAEFETIEILLLVDNRGTVYATEYAVLTTNGELGDFEADIKTDDIVRLYFTAYDATDKTITVLRTALSA